MPLAGYKGNSFLLNLNLFNMKVNVFFFRLLSLIFLTAIFSACSPKYGAHFNNSTSSSYTYKQEGKKEQALIVRQESRISVAAEKSAERSGAEKVKTDALPAIDALSNITFSETENLDSRREEVMHQVKERLQNMSRKEKRALKREIRQLKLSSGKDFIYEKASEFGFEQREVDENLALLIIIAILIPPLGVFLHQGEINQKFWISLILTLLGVLPGSVYAVLVVLGEL